MANFHQRKAERTEYYLAFVYGWKLIPCLSCNGSGKYDNDGSPDCGACDGSGKERVRGAKAMHPITNNFSGHLPDRHTGYFV